jgi:hypothetical protein
MEQTFYINNTKYWIEQLDIDSFFWANDERESLFCYPNQAAAQQDALEVAQMLIEERKGESSDEDNNAYWDAYNQSYNRP